MRTVWKFPLELTSQQELNVPMGAEPLTFQLQNEELCVWFLVDSNAQTQPLTVYIADTGEEVEGYWRYIGTAQQGEYVWHLFY